MTRRRVQPVDPQAAEVMHALPQNMQVTLDTLRFRLLIAPLVHGLTGWEVGPLSEKEKAALTQLESGLTRKESVR
ncbi:MAG: hypothetical protein AAB542_03125 [Patescibacteria group bacterium]